MRGNAVRGLFIALGACLSFAGAAPASAAIASPIMGVAAPEDIELMPDSHTLLISNYWSDGGRKPGGLAWMDLATERPQWLQLQFARQAGWGDPACTKPPEHIGPHGIHLSRRAHGRLQLLVVNHAGRESIEFIEIFPAAGNAAVRGIWRGCVISPDDAFNDVAATPQGGFIASVPVEKAVEEEHRGAKLLDGRNTGYLAEWAPGKGLHRIAGTDAPFANGVQLSADGRTIFYNAWTTRQVRAFDRRTGKEEKRTTLAFMPDNLSWRADGRLVAAGIDELTPAARCPQVDGGCAYAFGVAAIDPATMAVTPLYHGAQGIMPGTSVAIQTGNTLYIGGFLGNRLVKVRLAH